MYFLCRTLRFWTITGALLYTFTSLTPHVFSVGDWLGRRLHQLRAGNFWGGQQAPASAELLGAADQPASIQEYYKDAH